MAEQIQTPGDGVVQEEMPAGDSSGIVVSPALRASVVKEFRDAASYCTKAAADLDAQKDDAVFAHDALTKGQVLDVMADSVQRKACSALGEEYHEEEDPGEGEGGEGPHSAEPQMGQVRTMTDGMARPY